MNELEPLRLTGVITDEVTTPRADGSAGSALYMVPFRLNRMPDRFEAQMIVAHWDKPTQWSTMHRPGICRVSGDKVILDGTTMDEVEKYHLSVLKSAIAAASAEGAAARSAAAAKRESDLAAESTHRAAVKKAADGLDFN